MISQLKEIHRIVYLPKVRHNEEPLFKVMPIDEPYLYTDADLYVDTFDTPNPSVKVAVLNVGGGKLQVDQIQIPRGSGKWVQRGAKVTPATLTTSSEPLEIELELALKALPNPSTLNVAELELISNSKRKAFSKVSLGVRPSIDQAPKVKVPEHINFGEITVWHVSLTDSREDKTPKDVDFFLIWHLQSNPPTQFEITQKDDFTFDATLRSQQYQFDYKLNLQKPGVVMPQYKKDRLNLKAFRQVTPIANVSPHSFSGEVTSDTEWLTFPREINIEPYDITNFPVSLNVEKLKPGRNFGELVVSDKKIPVWAWFKIVHETTLPFGQDQPHIHHNEKCSEQEKPLQIEVVSTDNSYPSIMIFEDLDFHFPSTINDQVGYLIGDFNQWTPRTLFLEKRDEDLGVTLSISEGVYLYRAEIDGEMRLDPSRLYEIVCCSHGLASKIQANRPEQKITLRNRSKRQTQLKLQSSMDWMRTEPETIVLSANGKKEITVIFQPEFLKLGLNLGQLQIETTETPKKYLHSPIFVIGVTKGAVPLLRNDELAFPRIEQGKAEGIPFALDIFGEGELKGEIQPSTVLNLAAGELYVQNEKPFEPMKVTPLLQVLSEKPSNAYRKQIHASLITDCYLANRRLLRFVAKYDLVHLIADPPALYFPKVYLFDDPHAAEVIIKHNDGKGHVECSVEIPEKLTRMGFLKFKSHTDGGRMGRCRFVLNPQTGTDAGRFTGNLRIEDKKSGMSLPIQFAADIIGGQAKIDIQTRRQRLNPSSNELLLVITNVGKTELRIFEVRFKNLRFYLTPSLTSHQSTLLPGQSIERHIKAKNTFNLFGKTRVRDTLIVRLNDPQFSKGRFEKDIVTDIQGRFLNFGE